MYTPVLPKKKKSTTIREYVCKFCIGVDELFCKILHVFVERHDSADRKSVESAIEVANANNAAVKLKMN